MAVDPERLLNWPVPEAQQRLTERDTILYALGVGLGTDPTDEGQLRFLYEAQLQPLPTMAAVLAYPGFWQKDPALGLDWVRLLHAEQAIEIHRPLPVAGELVGRTRVTGLVDKGAEKGALLFQERRITDAASGELLCTASMTSFCRGDGGFGGPSGPVPAPAEIPERPADVVCDLPTLPQAALIYRLSGDLNPLHADPDVARRAGFERPILHGLCTFGVAGHALLRSCCGYDASAIRSLRVRFSAPVYPGETLSTEIWQVGPDDLRFRCRAKERDLLVLNNGQARLSVPLSGEIGRA